MLKFLLKTIFIVFALYLNLLNPNICFSQNNDINGVIIFNPRVSNIIGEYSFDALEQEGISVIIDSKFHHFKGKIPKEYSDKLLTFKLRVKFNDTTIYVNDRLYQRLPHNSFTQKILLEKTSDLYKNYKDRIENSSNLEEVSINFKRAFLYIDEKNNGHKNSQILELYRTASSRFFIIGEELNSIKYLEEGFNKVNFDKIIQQKKIIVYWSERIYRYLKINKYSTANKYPAKVVARNIVKSKQMINCWIKLTEQISKIYPDSFNFNSQSNVDCITKDIEQLLKFIENKDKAK